MRRMYISTADFRAPFDPVDFQGLGAVNLTARKKWPAGRSYYDTGNFRAPYDHGYFQDNQLFGVPSAVNLATNAPPLIRRFIASGEPVPTTLRDVSIPFNQIHRWIYGLIGVASIGLSVVSYRRWKKEKGTQKSSG